MDLANHQQDDYQIQHHPNSSLLRFRSAPSSFLSDNLESERLFSRFMCNSNNNNSINNDGESSLLNFPDFEPKSSTLMQIIEAGSGGGDNINRTSAGNDYSIVSPMYCRSELPPQYPKQSSYLDVNSTKTSNLLRQSSSPAGFFSQFNVHNGYGATRGMGNFRKGNDINEGASPSLSGLKDQINFSSGLPSSMGLLPQISEIGSGSVDANSPEDIKPGNTDMRFYGSAFPVSSWNDSSQFVQNDGKLLSSTQNGRQGNRPRILSHHLSLPKTSVEVVAMEKLLQFQDSVPCKIRAKRGCATHPRSIAERVRRTRISERMRKLQELVPNMDKQTNTADMLDLAVDYIKGLQRQFKTLSEYRAKCKCSSMQKSMPNETY